MARSGKPETIRTAHASEGTHSPTIGRNVESWAQQENEPNIWHQRFTSYRLIHKRSLLGCYREEKARLSPIKPDKPTAIPGAWKEACKRFSWNERAGDWDREQARSTEEVVQEARSGLVKKQVGLEGEWLDREARLRHRYNLKKAAQVGTRSTQLTRKPAQTEARSTQITDYQARRFWQCRQTYQTQSHKGSRSSITRFWRSAIDTNRIKSARSTHAKTRMRRSGCLLQRNSANATRHEVFVSSGFPAFLDGCNGR